MIGWRSLYLTAYRGGLRKTVTNILPVVFKRLWSSSHRWSPVGGLVLVSFPCTVHAISWGTDKSPIPKVYEDPNCIEAKLVNKQDQELIDDLKLADTIYQPNDGLTHQDILDKLNRHKDKREAELHWRLARVIYELSKAAESTQQKVDLIEQAFVTVTLAVTLDNTNFGAHKWMAIILNQRSSLKGTTEQIQQSYNVRKHMDKAVELNPKDPTSIHLVGNWCYTVAEIPWYQRKVAETLFATPPTCSFAEAIQYFLQAESIQPKFYTMNLLLLAKSLVKVGDTEKAINYLQILNDTPVRTDEDYLARKEGNELLKKLQPTKT